MKKVLVTGATGFLGSYLLPELTKTGVKIFALSRQNKENEDNVTWIQADISDESSLLRPEVIDELNDIDCIIHAAALYDLNAGHEELFRHNVMGTANILHLARLLKKVPHFAHISTIAIAGNAAINFDETLFDVGQTFPDEYASTKFASEHLVRSANDLPSRSVYRLGIVVGSSEDGKMTKIDGPYVLQKMIKSLVPLKSQIEKLKFLPLPYHEGSRLYIIPVDIASRLIVRLTEKVLVRPGISTFHVTGGGRGVSVRRALQTILAHYDISMNPIPMPKFVLIPSLLRAIKVPVNAGEYLHTKWTFSSKNLEKELVGFRYPSYAHFSKRMMTYADQHLFTKEAKK
jgi:nucleoside-diphosphate-sugar epimerase